MQPNASIALDALLDPDLQHAPPSETASDASGRTSQSDPDRLGVIEEEEDEVSEYVTTQV